MTSIKTALFKGAAVLSVGRLLISIIGFASTVVLARLLDPGDFGLIAIAIAVTMIVAAMAELPLSQAIIQHKEPEEEHFHTTWTLGLIRGALLAAVIAAGAVPIANVYDEPRLVGPLLVLAASAFFGSLQNPKLVVFERDLSFWRSVLLNLSDRTSSFIVSAGVAYVYRSYWALVLGVLAAQLVRTAVSYILSPYWPRISLSKSRELLSFSLWLTLGSWVQALNARSDPIVIGYFARPSMLGFYTMGDRLASMSIAQTLGPLSHVLFPALSRLTANPARLSAAYLRAQALLCTVAFPIGAGFAALAEPIVLLVLGQKWLPAVPVLQVLSIAAALEMIQHSGPLAMAAGRTKTLFGRDLVSFAVRAPLLLGGVIVGQASDIGVLMGAVIGRALGEVLNIIWKMYLVKRIAAIRLRDQFLGALRPFIAAGVMLSALYFVETESVISHGVDGYLILLALVVFGSLTYTTILMLIWIAQGRQPGPEREILETLRSAMPKLWRRYGSSSRS